jgi:hypothetical protein
MKRVLLILGVLALLVPLGWAIAQDNAPQPRLEITDINPSGLPEVVVGVSVVSASGVPVPDLGAADFAITCDLADVATITDVRSFTDSDVAFATVLIMDTSTSMEGAPLARAKEAAKLYLDKLAPGDQVALVAFDTVERVVLDFTADKAAVATAIDSLASGGQTALYDGAYLGVGIAADSPLSRRIAILLSDGAEYGGHSSQARGDALALAQSRGVTVATIALGYGVDRSFLTDLADGTNGIFFESPTPAELEAIYVALGDRFRTQYVVTLDVPVAGDGSEYALCLGAATDEGQTNADEVVLRAPILEPIITPVGGLPEGEINEATTLEFSIQADHPIDEIVIELNGTPVSDTASVTIDPTELAPGPYSVVVTATDSNGGVGTYFGTITIAALPPVLEINWAPPAGPISEAQTITLGATSQTPVTGVRYLLDGEVVAETDQPPYEFSFDPALLQPGTHTFTIEVSNAAGGVATQSYTIEIADLTPAFSLDWSLPAAPIVDPQELRFDFGDRLPRAMRFLIDGEEAAVLTEPPFVFRFDPSTLAPGEHTLTVAVEALNGTVTTSEYPFAVPAPIVPTVEIPTVEIPTVEAPTVEAPTVEAPTVEAPTVEAPTVEAPTVEAPTAEAPTVEAPTAEAPTVEAPTAEAPTVEAPTVEAPTVEAPTVEAPTVEAPTVEAPTAEAPTAEAVAFTLPSFDLPSVALPGMPGISLEWALPSEPIVDLQPFSIAFGDIIPAAVRLLVDGELVTEITEPPFDFAFNPADFGPGEHEITIEVVDGDGNVTPTTFTITVGEVAAIAEPVVRVNWDLPVGPLMGEQVLSVDVEGELAVAGVRYLLNDSVIAESGIPPYTLTFSPEDLEAGTHILRVEVNFEDGSVVTREFGFEVPPGAPAFALDWTVPEGEISEPQALTLDFGDGTPVAVRYLIDGVAVDQQTEAPFRFTLDPAFLTPGEHTLSIVVLGAAGQTEQTDFPLQVAPLAPAVAALELPRGIVTSPEAIRIPLDVTSQTELTAIRYQVGEGEMIEIDPSSRTLTLDPTALGDGEFPLRVEFENAAGLVSSVTGALRIQLPTALPSVSEIETAQAAASQEAATAEAPATDAPATDAPATDAPATDAPATDEATAVAAAANPTLTPVGGLTEVEGGEVQPFAVDPLMLLVIGIIAVLVLSGIYYYVTRSRQLKEEAEARKK